jgi:NAD(P)-dependent dehydrogenase (short-subunit alcohol dehydrogenase family)
MAFFDLTGKVAFITGTSRGLGQYFARALAQAGADIAMSSRDASKLAPFRKEIEALGRRTCGVDLDVRDHDSIKAAVASVEKQMGRIDILVNNAGCNARKPALEVTWEDWNMVLDTNLRGTFFTSQAVAPGHDLARLRTDREHRLRHLRRRLRRPRALWCQPRRREAAHHEPRR